MPRVRHYRNRVEWRLTSKTSDYTVLDIDDVVFVDATSGNVTITLPETEYQMVNIKRTDGSANTVTISGSGNIDGSASATLSQYDCLTLLGDGTDWWII